MTAVIRMQSVLLCLAVWLASCGCEDVGRGRQAVGPAVGPAKAFIDAEDAAVVQAALRHFAADQEVQASGSTASGPLVLYSMTCDAGGMISADQIAGEFKAGELPSDALGALVARNRGPVPLDAVKLDAALVTLRQVPAPANRSDDVLTFEQEEPGAKAWVRLWLPGFTSDNQHAVLRFAFGPTPHGATATYLLRRQADGQWVVAWRKLSYYV